MVNLIHERTIDNIINRLLQNSKHSFLAKHVPYTNSEGRTIGEMDICRIIPNNKYNIIEYWEIKTGYRGREKARHQARCFFEAHNNGLWIPHFIYYSTYTGFERWKKDDFRNLFSSH